MFTTMLEKDIPNHNFQFPEALERYLGELLHERIDVRPFEATRSLPSFIERTYTLYEARILGRHCVIVARLDGRGTPADIAKHIDIVRNATNATVAFATMTISAHNRSRLIGQGVPFIVPGNQLYIPDLAIDLREHFRAPRHRQADGLSPAAQTVLFHHILRPDRSVITPSLLAERLHYSAMSIGRAFDDLVAAGLAETIRHGKERHIHFKSEGRQLLEEATPLLRSPVRSLKFVRGNAFGASLKQAGEAALSQLTELARPRIDTFGVPASGWKAISQTVGLIETDRDEADCIIETWSYDPAALSDTSTVDPLSLYAQFRDHRDERVAMAADRLLEHLTW
ncbi:MarR family transcriptional regulator [Allomesorhizobium alhagi]|nr:MarR family transcriptional regulator [Mesorhizobium alhagi]